MTRNDRRLDITAPISVTTEILVRIICNQSSSPDLVASAALLIALIAKANDVLFDEKMGAAKVPRALVKTLLTELPDVEMSLRECWRAQGAETVPAEMSVLIANGCARLTNVLVPVVIDWPKKT
jgi:hypothetical protein